MGTPGSGIGPAQPGIAPKARAQRGAWLGSHRQSCCVRLFQVFWPIFRCRKGCQRLWNGRKQLLFFTIEREAMLTATQAVANGVGSRLRAEKFVTTPPANPHSCSDPFGGLAALGGCAIATARLWQAIVVEQLGVRGLSEFLYLYKNSITRIKTSLQAVSRRF